MTVAGWFGGLFVFALSKLITQLGALLVFIFLTLVLIYTCVRVAKRVKKDKKVKEKTEKNVFSCCNFCAHMA
jgi:membrane protein implicated in regulation of membrane protease activity